MNAQMFFHGILIHWLFMIRAAVVRAHARLGSIVRSMSSLGHAACVFLQQRGRGELPAALESPGCFLVSAEGLVDGVDTRFLPPDMLSLRGRLKSQEHVAKARTRKDGKGYRSLNTNLNYRCALLNDHAPR